MREQAEGGLKMIDDDEPLKFKWIRANWPTALGILIIIIVVMWHQTQITDIVNKNVDACNRYWKEVLDSKCPNWETEYGGRYNNVSAVFRVNLSNIPPKATS